MQCQLLKLVDKKIVYFRATGNVEFRLEMFDQFKKTTNKHVEEKNKQKKQTKNWTKRLKEIIPKSINQSIN